jgi:membrane associated rhomboid family serine protease
MVAGASNLIPGTGGAGVAWEAHLAGFLAGVLLVGPFARLAGRR